MDCTPPPPPPLSDTHLNTHDPTQVVALGRQKGSSWSPAALLAGANLLAGGFALLVPTETGFGAGLDVLDEKEAEAEAAAAEAAGAGAAGECVPAAAVVLPVLPPAAAACLSVRGGEKEGEKATGGKLAVQRREGGEQGGGGAASMAWDVEMATS